MPAPSPVSASLPTPPRCAIRSSMLIAWSTRTWLFSPSVCTIIPIPQASCSKRGSYSPCALGKEAADSAADETGCRAISDCLMPIPLFANKKRPRPCRKRRAADVIVHSYGFVPSIYYTWRNGVCQGGRFHKSTGRHPCTACQKRQTHLLPSAIMYIFHSIIRIGRAKAPPSWPGNLSGNSWVGQRWLFPVS